MDALRLEVQCAVACKTESETQAEHKPKTATEGDRVGTRKGGVEGRNFAASSRVVDPAFARPFSAGACMRKRTHAD